jgi:hypothetical protein
MLLAGQSRRGQAQRDRRHSSHYRMAHHTCIAFVLFPIHFLAPAVQELSCTFNY